MHPFSIGISHKLYLFVCFVVVTRRNPILSLAKFILRWFFLHAPRCHPICGRLFCCDLLPHTKIAIKFAHHNGIVVRKKIEKKLSVLTVIIVDYMHVFSLCTLPQALTITKMFPNCFLSARQLCSLIFNYYVNNVSTSHVKFCNCA